MAKFLQLPSELKLEIIEPLGLMDKVRLYGVCRELRKFMESQVYGSVELNNNKIILFVRSLLSRPSVALHLRHLRLRWTGRVDRQPWPGPNARRRKKSGKKRNYSASPTLGDITNRARRLGYPTEFCDALNRGSESTLVMLLLTIVTNIETLHVQVESSPLLFRWRMAELLRNHQYMPKLHQYHCEESNPEPASTTVAITLVPDILTISPSSTRLTQNTAYNRGRGNGRQQAKGKNIRDILKNNQPKFPHNDGVKNLLNTIYIETTIHRTPSLRDLISARSNLQAVSFSLSANSQNRWNIPFSTYELIDSLGQISHSLQSLTLSFPPNLLSLYRIDEDEFSTQSLKRFIRLGHLRLPIDALLGPDPKDAYRMWPLLPPSLRELYLDDIAIRRTISPHLQWTSERLLRAISDGINNLPIDFLKLTSITIGCLDQEDFNQLRQIIDKLDTFRAELHYRPKVYYPIVESSSIFEQLDVEDAADWVGALEQLREEQLYWSQSS